MRDERGLGVVEVILLGLVLLVPLLWIVSTLASLHLHALASTAAAREAGFALTRAPGEEADVHSAITAALASHGVTGSSPRVTVTAPRGTARGAALEIEVALAVPVFKIPVLDRSIGPAIWVRARHNATVQRYISGDR